MIKKDYLVKINVEYLDLIEVQLKEINNLKARIYKATEYINSYLPNYDFDKANLRKLLNILEGKE